MGAYGSPDLENAYIDKVEKEPRKPLYKNFLFWLVAINLVILFIVGIAEDNVLTILMIDSLLIFVISFLCIVYNLLKRNRISNYVKSLVFSASIFLVTALSLGGSSQSSINDISVDDYKNQCITVTFEQLAREPDKYSGTNVKITGDIVQVNSNGLNVALRVNTTEDYNDIVWINYTYSDGEIKLLQDDMINIWGVSKGETSYTSILGSKVTLPEIDAKYIEIIE